MTTLLLPEEDPDDDAFDQFLKDKRPDDGSFMRNIDAGYTVAQVHNEGKLTASDVLNDKMLDAALSKLPTRARFPHIISTADRACYLPENYKQTSDAKDIRRSVVPWSRIRASLMRLGYRPVKGEPCYDR